MAKKEEWHHFYTTTDYKARSLVKLLDLGYLLEDHGWPPPDEVSTSLAWDTGGPIVRISWAEPSFEGRRFELRVGGVLKGTMPPLEKDYREERFQEWTALAGMG